MADELIRLDTTIIGIDNLINKASTAEEAKVLFTVKDVIYSQQKYFTDVQPVKNAALEDTAHWIICCDGYYPFCSVCGEEPPGREMSRFCPNCGRRMVTPERRKA